MKKQVKTDIYIFCGYREFRISKIWNMRALHMNMLTLEQMTDLQERHVQECIKDFTCRKKHICLFLFSSLDVIIIYSLRKKKKTCVLPSKNGIELF